MKKEEVKNLVTRFAERFYKKENRHNMDYGSRFNPTRDPKTNKIKYKASPGDKFQPFWFITGPNDYRTYEIHITKHIDGFPVADTGNEDFYKSQIEARKKSNEVDMGIILQPCDLNGDSETKGKARWGAIDEDEYINKEHLKRIVKQIYDEKLPLAPCYSKSGGLHIYIFTKEMISGDSIVDALEHFKKILKATTKEINPKQTKPTWDKKKNRWSPGTGILLPWRSSVQIKYLPSKKGSSFANEIEYSFIKPDNAWIKNENMETGNLEEFLNYADTIELDQSFFNTLPLDLPEKERKEKPTVSPEERNFSETKARPLSEQNPLKKIIQNIRDKKKHDRGGTFDNHIVDFVYGAMESKMSDSHIHEHLKQFENPEETYEKSWKDYIQSKIENCREKYGKIDPGPLREKFMEDIIYNKLTEEYHDNSTKGKYSKTTIDITYANNFPKNTTPTKYFKEQINKQLAEEEIYRPDLYNEKSPLMKGMGGLYYINKYKPGNKSIKPEKLSDLKPWYEITELIVPIKKEREYFLDWLAFIVQNPWKKIKAIPVIRTKKQRMGKGSINDTMTDILDKTNAEPTDVKGMLDKGVTFAEKQLILIDECKSVGNYTEKSNLYNDLKRIATETRIQQRRLYVDYKVIETQTCILVYTNLKDALNIEKEDERFFVVSNTDDKREQSFYKAYHKWREDKGSNYVRWFLENRDISKFDPMAPPPMTEAKKAMIGDTGHPLTLKLREMLDEGEHPFGLDTKIIGSTELAHYIGKHHRGKHVQYANDTKQIKKSLEEIGGIELGQILHKAMNYKPSLWIIRDHEEMQRLSKTKVCNEIWKPLNITLAADEKQDEEATDRFQKNQTNGANAFEERFYATNCWSCGKPINTDTDEKCPECNFAIKCECGKCACDNPKSKVKKKEAYA